MRSLLALSVAVLSLPLLPAAQSTNTRTASIKVTADVVNACQLTVVPLAFGAYDPVATNRNNPLDGAAEVTVTCTKGTVATVELDEGQNPFGGVLRTMAGPGTGRLAYDLFRDAARSARWGAGADGLSLPAAPSLAPRKFAVYGRVAGGQDVPTGAYHDDVIVSVRF